MILKIPVNVFLIGASATFLNQLKIDQIFTPYAMGNVFCKIVSYIEKPREANSFCSMLPGFSTTPVHPWKIGAIAAGLYIFNKTEEMLVRRNIQLPTWVSGTTTIALYLTLALGMYNTYFSDGRNSIPQAVCALPAHFFHMIALDVMRSIAKRYFFPPVNAQNA